MLSLEIKDEFGENDVKVLFTKEEIWALMCAIDSVQDYRFDGLYDFLDLMFCAKAEKIEIVLDSEI